MKKDWYAALTIDEQSYLLRSGIKIKHVNSEQDLWLIVSLFATLYAKFTPDWYDLVRRLSDAD